MQQAFFIINDAIQLESDRHLGLFEDISNNKGQQQIVQNYQQPDEKEVMKQYMGSIIDAFLYNSSATLFNEVYNDRLTLLKKDR